MPRHLIVGDEKVLDDGTTEYPARLNWNFTGAGVDVTDNGGSDETIVNFVGGGGLSFIDNKWASWGSSTHDPSTVTGSPYYLVLGEDWTSADTSWFGGAGHNPAGGRIGILEKGLYHLNFSVVEVETLSAMPAVPVAYAITMGGSGLYYPGNTEILNGASPTQLTIGTNINVISWINADEQIRLTMERGTATPTSIPSMNIDFMVRRIL